MPRRQTQVEDRERTPDPVYESKLVSRLISSIMSRGKKQLAEQIVYDAFEEVEGRTGEDPLEIFERAVDNCRPKLEVRPRRVGGATFQVPMEVDKPRSISLALRWIKEAAEDRNEYNMEERLANEILDASNYSGGAFEKRESVHQMAEANRAFAHYRW
jgi:small subunit ribosomal protein S7